MRVYEYGAQAPRANATLVAEQMSLAHRYYNTLVELERRRRDEYEALMREHDGYLALAELAASLDEDVEAVREQIRLARQRGAARVDRAGLDERQVRAARKTAGGAVDTAALAAQVRDLREALGFARALAREAKATARAELAEPLEAINADDLVRRKAARATCGVWWGSYLVQEDAMEQARKALDPPGFRRWQGSGHLQVQLIHGITAAELFGCQDTRVQLRAPAPDAWDTRRSRRRNCCTILRMRIGSNEDRSPVWTEVPIFMHRPLPADAAIKRVHLLRERMADRERWKVQFTVETAEVKRAPAGHGTVAVDIGWRVMPEGLRVAFWHDDAPAMLCSGADVLRDTLLAGSSETRDADGNGGQFVLDHALLSALTKADSLRSIRDRNLDELKAALVPAVRTLLAGLPASETDRVGFLLEAAATMHLWKAPARFAALAKRWAEARFDSDGLAYLALASWAKQDLHLWQWEVHQRDKSLRRRREHYRMWAAKLADQYAEIVLEGESDEGKVMDLRPMVVLNPPEGTDLLPDEARHGRVLAATSILRDCLVQAFQARQRVVRLKPAKGTTMRCHVCGLVTLRTDALMQTCACGVIWDQDFNAAINLLRPEPASGDVPGGSPSVLDAPKYAGSRWMRRKEEKAVRAAANATEGCSNRLASCNALLRS
jgi:Putative transposase DNA-binding domain